MDTKLIKELIEIMDEAQLTALRVDDGDCKVELERSATTISQSALPLVADRVSDLLARRAEGHEAATAGTDEAVSAETAATLVAATAETGTSAVESAAVLVRSPTVGTFYLSPSPDEKPFVKVGQEVISGQTLAIVEAMKMMNEVTSPAPGVVVEVLAANGAQVEYDQPLFRIAPATARELA